MLDKNSDTVSEHAATLKEWFMMEWMEWRARNFRAVSSPAKAHARLVAEIASLARAHVRHLRHPKRANRAEAVLPGFHPSEGTSRGAIERSNLTSKTRWVSDITPPAPRVLSPIMTFSLSD
jgi:hypothetical protein